MDIFRNSRLQMFFKIGALKILQYSKLKGLQHRCFSVNITKCLRTGFLQNFLVDCFCIILKEIDRQRLFFKKYPHYDILIIFPLNAFQRDTSFDV